MAGWWEFPGGKVAAGESDAQALVRELREELGVEARPDREIMTLSHEYPDRVVDLVLWRATIARRAARLDGQQLKWVDCDSLGMERLLPADRPFIAALQLLSSPATFSDGRIPWPKNSSSPKSSSTPRQLYREEIFTDRKAGTLRRLVPVKSDGSDDASRPVLYSGQTQLLTPAGVLPLAFELEAASLEDACNKFPDAVKIAIEQAIEEAREMRREAASRIVVPEGRHGWAAGGRRPHQALMGCRHAKHLAKLLRIARHRAPSSRSKKRTMFACACQPVTFWRIRPCLPPG